MLDILGFKDLLKWKEIEEIHQIMRDLIKAVREGTHRDFGMTINGATRGKPLVRLNYFIFSDTILVWKDYEKTTRDKNTIVGDCTLS